MDFQSIRTYFEYDKIRWTKHIVTQMTQRTIFTDDIWNAITNGEVIGNYPNDYPDPSCLILGFSNNHPIHVVCGIHEDELWLITAYVPNTDEWAGDFRSRKE